VGYVLILVAVIVVFLLLRAGASSHREAVRRALRADEPVPIEEFPDGAIATIAGRIRYGQQTLRSPLSDRRCTYYYAHVKKNRTDAGGASLAAEEDARPFFVEDATGWALVALDSDVNVTGMVEVVKDRHKHQGLFGDAEETIVRFLKRHDQPAAGVLFNKLLHFEEGVLAEGEAVRVRGLGRWETDPTGDRPGRGYRAQGRQLVLRAPGDGQLYISDDPELLEP